MDLTPSSINISDSEITNTSSLSIPTNIIVNATDKNMSVSLDAVSGAESYDVFIDNNITKSAIKKNEPLTGGTLKSGAQAEKISGSNIKHLNGAIGEA